MTLRRNRTMPLAAVGIVVLSAGVLAGCTPEPEPTPTPTAAFASEEEAFAAAEEVYRAYNEAVNAQRAGDESVDPRDFLTGEVLDAEITAAQQLEETGVHIEGDTNVISFAGTASDFTASVAKVDAQVCVDISGARAMDQYGVDVTSAGRSDVYAIDVTFSGGANSLLISKYEVAQDVPC